MASFSERHGFSSPLDGNVIRFREELPVELRSPILKILISYSSDVALRELISELFDPYGITPPREFMSFIQVGYGETATALEVRRFVLNCPWNKLYDLIEGLLENLVFHEDELAEPWERTRSKPLQAELNAYFRYAGIGWQLIGTEVRSRGDEGFQQSVETSVMKLQESGRPTAASHIRSALKALSERPKANTPGAVSHATSAVESLLNDITGEALPLGKYLDRHPSLFHPALRKALDGVYGYACDAGARHGKEGVEPGFDQAQFAVTTCAAACTLLGTANPKRPQ